MSLLLMAGVAACTADVADSGADPQPGGDCIECASGAGGAIEAAVGAGGDENTLVEAAVVAEVGPDGGTIEAPCGSLAIPEGALEETTTITIESLSDYAVPHPIENVGAYCQLDFGGVELLSPATLTLKYDRERLPSEPPATLVPVGNPDGANVWEALSAPSLPVGGELTAWVVESGVYGPALALATTPLCAAGISFCAAVTAPYPSQTAPQSWTGVPGTLTGQYEMDRLFKYYDNPAGYVSEGLCALSLGCFWDGLSGQTQLDILTKCSRLPCPYDLICAARIVSEELSKDSDNSCRHHAWAMRDAAALLGYSADFQCGWDGLIGHAWVEVKCGGNTYLIDAHADTYVSTTGPVPPWCGNDTTETGEECDGKDNPCDATEECIECQCVPLCGNNRLDAGEQCDGTANACGAAEECVDCQCEPLRGNSRVDPGEQCGGSHDCPSGQECQNSQCVATGSVCGNGELESGEQCESDLDCDSSSECVNCRCVPRCGNNRLDDGEQCDGTAQPPCAATEECVNCQCQPLCGNHRVDTGEECDGVGRAQCTEDGEQCYSEKCKCVVFVQCAGIEDRNMCLACCEGATTNEADYKTCVAAHCSS